MGGILAVIGFFYIFFQILGEKARAAQSKSAELIYERTFKKLVMPADQIPDCARDKEKIFNTVGGQLAYCFAEKNIDPNKEWEQIIKEYRNRNWIIDLYLSKIGRISKSTYTLHGFHVDTFYTRKNLELAFCKCIEKNLRSNGINDELVRFVYDRKDTCTMHLHFKSYYENMGFECERVW